MQKRSETKTTITTQPQSAPLYINVAGDLVEVVTGKGAHKYVGKLVPGDLEQRAQIDYAHKIRLAWNTIHYLSEYLHKCTC